MKQSKIVITVEDEIAKGHPELVNIINNQPDAEMQEELIDILKRRYYIREDLELARLIGMQPTYNSQKEVYLAIMDEYIRNHRDILRTIANQDDWSKQQQIRMAAENIHIRSNKFVFDTIVSEPTWDRQRALRLAAEKEYIRDNKFILLIIASQDTVESKEVLVEAAGYEIIRNNLEYFKLIASQGYHLSQQEMMLAIKEPVLRNNPWTLKIIDRYKKECMLQEQARLNLTIKSIRDNLNYFEKIMNNLDVSNQEKLREAYTRNENVDIDSFIQKTKKK